MFYNLNWKNSKNEYWFKEKGNQRWFLFFDIICIGNVKNNIVCLSEKNCVIIAISNL